MISAPFLQSDIEEMADLLFFPDAVERRIAMFAAYFDDSGTHSESSVVSIAGYIAGQLTGSILRRNGINYFLEKI